MLESKRKCWRAGRSPYMVTMRQLGQREWMDEPDGEGGGWGHKRREMKILNRWTVGTSVSSTLTLVIVVRFIERHPRWVVTVVERALVQSDKNTTDPWGIFFM